MGRKYKNSGFSLEGLGEAIQSWLSYRLATNQNCTLVEASINYPFCDYLRPFLSKKPKITPLEFEVGLDLFRYKHCDAKCILEKVNNENDSEFFFEFKYTKDNSTRDEYEQARVLLDLIRLYSIQGKSKNIFIMCGKSEDFQTDFKNFDSNRSKNIKLKKNNPGATPLSPNYFYQKLFSFDMNNPFVQINLNQPDPDFTRCLTVFYNEYENYCMENIETFVKRMKYIETKLEWISPDNVSANVGIWSVKAY